MNCRGHEWFIQRRSSNYNEKQSFGNILTCGCHNLNLCGVHSAECCPQVITFFGVVQKLYNLFSSSPQRWEILTSSVGCSLHNPSETRWSARVDSVKPFAAHFPGVMTALSQVQELNLTPETRSDVVGKISYLSSYEPILMASLWLKILTAINFRNLLLQAREVTLDVEVANIHDLIGDLKLLRSKWDEILSESKLVAESCGIEQSLCLAETKRKRRRQFLDRTVLDDNDDQQDSHEQFKRLVFYAVIDCVIANLTTRYEAAKNLNELFGVLWKYRDMNTENVLIAAKNLADKYADNINTDLLNELEHLKTIHVANLGQKTLTQFDLLNRLIDTFENRYIVSKRCHYATYLLHTSGYRCSSRKIFQHIGPSEKCSEIDNVSRAFNQSWNAGSGRSICKND